MKEVYRTRVAVSGGNRVMLKHFMEDGEVKRTFHTDVTNNIYDGKMFVVFLKHTGERVECENRSGKNGLCVLVAEKLGYGDAPLVNGVPKIDGVPRHSRGFLNFFCYATPEGGTIKA